jgi:pimeloyl-ACP methyl ester carboxylesterase
VSLRSLSLFRTLGSHIDHLGLAQRERYALKSCRCPGYGVMDTGTAQVRYRMHGQGPAVAFMTDPPNVLEHYDDLVDELARDHTVLILEMPGFGFSPIRRGVIPTFSVLQEAVLYTLRTLHGGPYVLAFPCVTAFLALAIAYQHPSLVSGLLLSQAPSWNETLTWKARMDANGMLRTPVLGQLIMHFGRRRIAQRWYQAVSGTAECCNRFTAIAHVSFQHGAAFPLATGFQHLLVEGNTFAPVDQRTLFIWGLRDRSHKRTNRTSSLTLAANGQILESAEHGHFPELEDPAWFAGVLRSMDG